MTPTRDAPPDPRAVGGRASIDHVNEVVLIGVLSNSPETRSLPTGEEVLSFRVLVRTSSSAAPGRPSRIDDASRGRNDRVDCVAVRAQVRSRLSRYGEGDLIRVVGSLRHRYWRGAGGINSRYEVEADSISLIKRQPAPPP